MLDKLAPLQRRWPDDPALALLKAEALVRLLDLGPPTWPEPDCRAAAAALNCARAVCRICWAAGSRMDRIDMTAPGGPHLPIGVPTGPVLTRGTPPRRRVAGQQAGA